MQRNSRNTPNVGFRGRPPRGYIERQKPQNFKATLKRLLKYLGYNKFYIISMFVVMIIVTITSLTAPVLQGNAIDAIRVKNSVEIKYWNFDKTENDMIKFTLKDEVIEIDGTTKNEYYLIVNDELTNIIIPEQTIVNSNVLINILLKWDDDSQTLSLLINDEYYRNFDTKNGIIYESNLIQINDNYRYIVNGTTTTHAIGVDESQLFINILLSLTTIYALSIVMTFFRGLISAYLSQSTVKKMRKDLFEKIVRLPIRYFDTNAHGDIMSRMTNDVESISNTISQSVASLISGVLVVTGSLLVMMLYSPLLTLISLVSLALTMIFTKFMSKRMRKYFKMQQTLLGDLNSQVEESVVGHKTITAYVKEYDFQNQFNNTSNDLEKCAIKANIYGGIMGPMMNIISNIGFLLIVVFGALFLKLKIGAGAFGPLTIGSIIIFTNCSKQFSRPINEIATLYAQIETSFASAERVFNVMDVLPELDEGTENMSSIEKIDSISFEHVYFSYVEGELVLKDFSLNVKSGQKIALVGATGSGKTTIVNLLMRFYDVDAGVIKINGIDIRKFKKDDLRSAIAIVLQDTILFSDTIKSNIAYGALDASLDEIEKSAVLSNADAFISLLPAGYDTKLSESGSNLSQGQRQLLSIARAALANPRILILDEATSSVDTRTEKNIQNAMVALMKNRTSLIIAHRLSTIRDADMIVVIDKGMVMETGSHDDLINQKGIYYKLYQTQFAGNAI